MRVPLRLPVGVPPTIVEVSAAMSLSNRMGSYSFLNALEATGYVRRLPGAPRGLVVLRGVNGEAISRFSGLNESITPAA